MRSKQSFELRLVQRVTYGRNDIVMASAFGSPALGKTNLQVIFFLTLLAEQDKRIVLHGAKLKHDVRHSALTHSCMLRYAFTCC